MFNHSMRVINVFNIYSLQDSFNIKFSTMASLQSIIEEPFEELEIKDKDKAFFSQTPQKTPSSDEFCSEWHLDPGSFTIHHTN